MKISQINFFSLLNSKIRIVLLLFFIQTNCWSQSNGFEVLKNLEIMDQIFEQLELYYVDNPETGKVSKAAIDAMLKDLDPYTVYYHEANIEDYRLLTTGQYGGLGAQIVKIGLAQACMSDDMDMFMYGCPRVIRDVNVSEQTMVCYDTYSILKQLGFTLHEFKQIGVLSGSDYYKSSYTLYTVVSMFHAFKRTEHTDFYEWVNLHHSIEVDRLREAYHAFTPQLEQPSGSDD